MNFKQLWHSLNRLDNSDLVEMEEVHKFFFINAIMLFALVLFLFFSLYNLFVSHLYKMLAVDLSGFVLVSLTMWGLYRWKKIELISTLLILFIFTLTLTAVAIQKNQDYILIYSVFMPMMAIFLKGPKRGFIYALVFILTLISMLITCFPAYKPAPFTTTSLVNIMMVLFGVTILAFYYETGRRRTFVAIQKVRDRYFEQNQLLNESHARYEALFNQLPEAAWIVDAKTASFIDINQASISQYGYSKDEFLHKLHISDIDVYDSKEVVEARAKRILETGGEIFETKHRCKDGRIIDVLVSTKLIIYNNELLISGTFLDITTQKKQAQEINRVKERYISLFENLPQPAWVVEPQTQKYVSINKAFQDHYGYTMEDLKDKEITMINIRDSKEKIADNIQRVLNGEEVIIESWHRIKSGDVINVIINARRVVFEDHEYVVAVMTDITKQKILQMELEDLTNSLQERVADEVEKNREKDHIMHDQAKSAQMGEMLRMIAHQWRQPLNAISASSIELSLKNTLNQLDDALIEEHSSFVQEQTKMMSKTINDFMEFFKPEQKKRHFTMKEIFDEILTLMGVQIKNRGILLHYDQCQQTELYSYFKELIHVIINLLSNSRDAFEESHSSKRDIFVACRQEQEDLIITISDTAGGIPESIIDNVFDPYFTTKEQGKGTGIGLYMSKRIVEEILKGTIDVHNDNDGAVFTLSIPTKKKVAKGA